MGEAEKVWSFLSQSAKKKAKKINFRNWWGDKGKKKVESDEKDGNEPIVVVDDSNDNHDSWGPKWFVGPPPPQGGLQLSSTLCAAQVFLKDKKYPLPVGQVDYFELPALTGFRQGKPSLAVCKAGKGGAE